MKEFTNKEIAINLLIAVGYIALLITISVVLTNK